MRLTLRTKTTLLTTSLVLALVGITALWQYRSLSNEYVNLMREQQQELTQVAAADLDYKLAMHQRVLERAARATDPALFADPAGATRFFTEAGLRPMFDGAALVALDGTLLVNDPPLQRPMNVADREYFRRTVDSGQATISAPLMARPIQQPAVLITAPVRDAAGRVVGLLSAGLMLNRPNVLGNLGQARAGRGGRYEIVSQGPAPVYVVHADEHRLLQPEASTTTSTAAAQDVVTSAPIPSTGWQLRVIVPAQQAYAPLTGARAALLQQMLWLGLVSGLLVWAGTFWLMRPLSALYGTIRELRQSPGSPVKLDLSANDERGDLAREFHALVEERSRSERALRESEARLRTVANALPMRVAYIDAEERYQFNNQAYERGFGKTTQEIRGRTVRELLGEQAYEAVRPHIAAALRGETVSFQSELATSEGYVCYEAHYIPQRAADNGAVIGFHAVVTDITRQKREERRLVQLARIDPLTGLANRAGFESRLAEAMQRSHAQRLPMALVYLDIDRFKQVNDEHGHPVGDALLRAFAGRLAQTVRSTDFLTRLGGDEFTVIMEDLPDAAVAELVGQKVVQAMRAPFVIEGLTLPVTTSAGLACYAGGPETPELLVRLADEMLYQAKAAGRDNLQTAPAPAPAHG